MFNGPLLQGSLVFTHVIVPYRQTIILCCNLQEVGFTSLAPTPFIRKRSSAHKLTRAHLITIQSCIRAPFIGTAFFQVRVKKADVADTGDCKWGGGREVVMPCMASLLVIGGGCGRGMCPRPAEDGRF